MRVDNELLAQLRGVGGPVRLRVDLVEKTEKPEPCTACL